MQRKLAYLYSAPPPAKTDKLVLVIEQNRTKEANTVS